MDSRLCRGPAENPQLYFSHQLKTGDALQLAQQIRPDQTRIRD